MNAAEYVDTEPYRAGVAAAEVDLERARQEAGPQRCMAGCGREVRELGGWCDDQLCVARRAQATTAAQR